MKKAVCEQEDTPSRFTEINNDWVVTLHSPVIIPQHMIVTGSWRSLYACMTAQVEVELRRVCNDLVHRSTGRNISWFSHLVLFVCTEKAGVVTLLHNYECYARLVTQFQLDTGFPNRA